MMEKQPARLTAWVILPVPSPRINSHTSGVDDVLISIQFSFLFPVWVTSAKHNWVTFA
jgi:hypothetical protein